VKRRDLLVGTGGAAAALAAASTSAAKAAKPGAHGRETNVLDPTCIDPRFDSRSISFENLTGAQGGGGKTGFREAHATDVLDRAQALLAQRYRVGAPVLTSPALTREFLRAHRGLRAQDLWRTASGCTPSAHRGGESFPRHDQQGKW
jgi:hypothetical protein